MALLEINGVNLWVEEEGSGPAMVFVHEFGGDHRVWREQINHFRDRYRCVAFNARGYPPSDVPDEAEAYGQDIAIADMLGVLDALNIDKAHLLGLSMGAYNVLRFALDHPDRVLSLTATHILENKPRGEHSLPLSIQVACGQNSQFFRRIVLRWWSMSRCE